MVTLFHGDNTTQSRQAFVSALGEAQRKGEVLRLEAKALSLRILEEALGTQALFFGNKTVIIEELFSLPKSKAKDEYIKQIAQVAHVDVLLWESKQLSPAQLKNFVQAKVLGFKLNPVVFAWLDSLFPGNLAYAVKLLQAAVERESAEMCFAMLARQIRLLLSVKDGVIPKLAPFSVAKLQKQARAFPWEQLLHAHAALVDIDRQQKTSATHLSLHAQLDLLMAELLDQATS